MTTQTVTTNNTTTASETTTTQQVQNQQQFNSPFRKVDPVQDLLYLQKEKERSSRREKLLKIKEALLDGSHFKDGFLDSIGVDKKYSDRVRVKFSVNTEDEFIADATFDSVQLSKFNSGKLDFSSDKFGWSPIVENTMNLWVKTIFMEAKKWLDYEDSRKVELLTELSGPNGFIDSENHLRKELCDDLQIGDDLRTNILITPIIDGDNRLVLNVSYKGIPVTGFRSNPFNFLSDSYGNSVTEKDIEGWLGAVAKDIMNISATTTSPSQQAVSTSQQAVPIAELSPEAQKRKDEWIKEEEDIFNNLIDKPARVRKYEKFYGLERYGNRISFEEVFDDASNTFIESVLLDGKVFSQFKIQLNFESEFIYGPDYDSEHDKWWENTTKTLKDLSA